MFPFIARQGKTRGDGFMTWDKATIEPQHTGIPDAASAYRACVDHQIGRTIQQVEDMGKLGNELRVFVPRSRRKRSVGPTRAGARWSWAPIEISRRVRWSGPVRHEGVSQTG